MSTPAPGPSGAYDLQIDVQPEGERRRIVLRGELDLASAANLQGAISRLCGEGAREIVLDIGALDFIDSTGLRAILMSKAACEGSGCSFGIAPTPDRVPGQVRRLLQVTGLLERLPFEEPTGT
jgi:anti-sigma B factor antagonist